MESIDNIESIDKTESKQNTSGRKLLIGCGGCLLAFICISAVLAVGAGIWLFSGPDGGVKFNNEMDQYALDYLQANNILESGEELVAYYDTTVSMDGTEAAVLTTERVIYHKDGRTTAIPLQEISDIQHHYDSWSGDIIEVTSSSGVILRIEIAPLNDGEIFLNALKSAHNQAVGQ